MPNFSLPLQRRPLLTACAAAAALLLVQPLSALAAEKRITVAADGSGNFKTIQEAFAAVPENSAERTIILVKPGVYQGQKLLAKNRNKVTLQGENAETTILSFEFNVKEDGGGADPKFKGIGVLIQSDDFTADKLTFRNTSGDHGQALALRIDGDRAIVTNSRLLGWQDTLMVNNGRHYFKNCYIEGRVDFIYGSGTSVFDQCEIKSKNGGYVTAANTPADKPVGFVFLNSRLSADPAPWIDPTGEVVSKPQVKPPQAYLGRPWRQYASVAFINCEMGEHIRPEGWHNWGKEENEKTARYAEYNSRGPGANPPQRVGWSKQLSKAEADALTLTAILGGSDNWRPWADAVAADGKPKK
ncbi:MAG: pectinesterase family protein [Massilia sp.]